MCIANASPKTNRALTYKTSILLLNLFLIILQDGKRNVLAVNTGSVGPTVDIEQTQANTSKKFFLACHDLLADIPGFEWTLQYPCATE